MSGVNSVTDGSEHQGLLSLTTEIVASFAGNNTVAVGDLPAVIGSVFQGNRCLRATFWAGRRRFQSTERVLSVRPDHILGATALARSASHSGSRFRGSNFAASSALAQSGRPALRA